MHWIDEMFTGMEKDQAADTLRRSEKKSPAHPEKHVKDDPDTVDLWGALTTAIANDVSEFNGHKERKGKMAAHTSNRRHRCEVYLPGMQSKRLVLVLEENALNVSIHPEFPPQQLAITIAPGQHGRQGCWVLGDPSQEGGKMSAQQLSEYLLKPVLSSADINRTP